MITSKDLPAKYKLKFLPEALKEWHQLDGSIKLIFRKALKKRLVQPKVPGSELHGDLKDCYKIKLLKHGYRLVYTIENQELVCWFSLLIKEKIQLHINLHSFASCPTDAVNISTCSVTDTPSTPATMPMSSSTSP
ncbi:MAG: type II toxin-antitoxin system RelE/ParE family toxin [Burkholderiales bacterium]|nr:type II toxin-antitoxin system RelE/ParE family toxin [Burkholderiales bacterium]